MNTQIITPEHKKAGIFFLAIFALAAMLFFTSCSVAKREGGTSPCYNAKAFSGFAKDNQNRKIHMVKRHSF